MRYGDIKYHHYYHSRCAHNDFSLEFDCGFQSLKEVCQDIVDEANDYYISMTIPSFESDFSIGK